MTRYRTSLERRLKPAATLILCILGGLGGCTTVGIPKDMNLAQERVSWEKQRQQEREREVLIRPTLTPPITAQLERNLNPPDSQFNLKDEQYEFFLSDDTRYLRCRFRLHTGQSAPVKLFYFIAARNFEYKHKIEQIVPAEVFFNQQDKPNYDWGYEIAATDGVQLENLLPRPSHRLHYNQLTYYFYSPDGQELLRHEVKLNYTESPYVLENIKYAEQSAPE